VNRETFFHDVGFFHAKFDLPEFSPVRPIRCGFDMAEFHELVRYRVNFMQEELDEFKDAVANRDPAAMLDALCDLAWVAMGTAHYFNLPFHEAWMEVARSNLAKERRTVPDANHKRGAVEKIVKPDGWQPPQLERVLAFHAHRVESHRAHQEALDRAHDTDLNGDDHEAS